MKYKYTLFAGILFGIAVTAIKGFLFPALTGIYGIMAGVSATCAGCLPGYVMDKKRMIQKCGLNAEGSMNKATPKQIRKRSLVILVIGVAVSFLGIALNQTESVIIIGLIIVLSSMIHHIIFFRCPHCGKYLDRNSGDYCPYCGKQVNESQL